MLSFARKETQVVIQNHRTYSMPCGLSVVFCSSRFSRKSNRWSRTWQARQSIRTRCGLHELPASLQRRIAPPPMTVERCEMVSILRYGNWSSITHREHGELSRPRRLGRRGGGERTYDRSFWRNLPVFTRPWSRSSNKLLHCPRDLLSASRDNMVVMSHDHEHVTSITNSWATANDIKGWYECSNKRTGQKHCSLCCGTRTVLFYFFRLSVRASMWRETSST